MLRIFSSVLVCTLTLFLNVGDLASAMGVHCQDAGHTIEAPQDGCHDEETADSLADLVSEKDCGCDASCVYCDSITSPIFVLHHMMGSGFYPRITLMDWASQPVYEFENHDRLLDPPRLLFI